MTGITTKAPDISVQTANGGEARLSDFWREGLTAFTFIRYLACIFCREQVTSYRDHATEIASAGLRVVIITPAMPEESAEFAHRLALPFPVLCDPERRAYLAYGLTEGSFGQLLNPHVVARGLRATLRGHLITPPRGGNPRQLPGTAIVDREGNLRFHHVARDAADHVTVERLIAEATRIRATIVAT